MSTYFFLVFQIEIDAANDCDERHKTKHNQCSHIIFLSLFYPLLLYNNLCKITNHIIIKILIFDSTIYCKTKSLDTHLSFLFCYFFGSIIFVPPIYGHKTSGTFTEPSSFNIKPNSSEPPVGSIHFPTGDGEQDINPNVINKNVNPNIFFIPIKIILQTYKNKSLKM